MMLTMAQRHYCELLFEYHHTDDYQNANALEDALTEMESSEYEVQVLRDTYSDEDLLELLEASDG